MPSGCFEQTSSTTYPNVMALSYMKDKGIERPEAAAKAGRYIELGYQRLVSFEVKGGGFDWFGRPPANPILTAYGLMEFADMARVHPVDGKLLRRTAQWLASEQDPSGAWRFRSGCFHEPFTGHEVSDLAVTAYVTWAVAVYDPNCDAARRGAAYVAAHVGEARSPRTLALCANALLAADPDGLVTRGVLDELAKLANRAEKGQAHWSGAGRGGDERSGPRYGRGEFGDVETTALAALALSRKAEHASVVSDSLRWLAAKRDPHGTWGTTQGTVLALKALLAGSKTPAKRSADAMLAVRSAGGNAGAELARLTIPADKSDIVHAVRLPVEKPSGTCRLVLSSQNAAGMAYQFVVRYHTLAAAPADQPLEIKVEYDRTELQTDQGVTVRAVITNRTAEQARMLLADIGTPPGFSVEPAGLDTLRDAGKIDRYTLTARGVIVYIGSLGPGESLTVSYRMIARMPLKAVAAPTSVYAYYDPARTAAAAPVQFTVR